MKTVAGARIVQILVATVPMAQPVMFRPGNAPQDVSGDGQEPCVTKVSFNGLKIEMHVSASIYTTMYRPK